MTEERAATIITFPSEQRTKRARRSQGRIKNVDGIKYFNEKQIKLLRRAAREQAEIDEQRGNVTGVRECMVIDLLTSTGLRVSEAANLRCGDLKLGYSESKIYVREGKGRVSGHVVINESLKRRLKLFLSWKRALGEAFGDADHLFVG